MRKLLGLVALASLAWCLWLWGPSKPGPPSAADPRGSPRVLHEPVGDEPGRVVIRLAPRVYVAYDASTCGYSMAWTGGLSLDVPPDGAAPLPVPEGEPSNVGVEGCPWQVSDRDGSVLAVRVRYRGCRLEEEDVMLAFELELPAGQLVRIEERPSVLDAAELDAWWEESTGGMDSGWPEDMPRPAVLRRRFAVAGLPSGFELHMRYARTVASVTSIVGWRVERAPQGDLDRDVNAALRLTLEDGAAARLDVILADE